MNRKRYEREREFGEHRYCIDSARSFFIVPFFGLFVFRIVSNRGNIQGGLFNTLIIFIPVSFQAVLLSCIEKKRKYKFEFNVTDEKSNFDQLRESNQDGHVTGSTL